MNAERHDINGFTFEVSHGISVIQTGNYDLNFFRSLRIVVFADDKLAFTVRNDGFTPSADCQNGNGRAAIDVDVNVFVTRPKLRRGGNFRTLFRHRYLIYSRPIVHRLK
jgi:hypothetical protein